MHIKTTERLLSGVFTQLDEEVWNKVAEKAVGKMPKYKLANESLRMFHDFTILNSQENLESAGQLFESKDQSKTFK